MAPVLGLTAAMIYLLDYDSAVEKSGDDYELNGKSVGDDYCYLWLLRSRESNVQDGLLQRYWGETGETGEGYFIRYNKSKNIMRAGGYVESRTELKYVKKWFAKSMDNEEDPDYLCIKYDTGDYYPFYAKDRSEWEYAKGWCKNISGIHYNNEKLEFYPIEIEFHVVWP